MRRVLTATVAIVGLVAPAPGHADFSTSDYSHAGSGCNNRVDPVTLVFIGVRKYSDTHGHSWKTFDWINGMPDPQHDWKGVPGGTQYASSHSVCTPMERQSATADGGTRYHIRLNQTHHQDTQGRWETVGTPHYEIEAPNGCGHVVPPDSYTSGNGSGFVLGRGHVKNDWLSVFGSDELFRTDNWGNTEPQRQCNGWYAANADGIVYWLETDT